MLENENHNKFLIKLFSNFVTDENGHTIWYLAAQYFVVLFHHLFSQSFIFSVFRKERRSLRNCETDTLTNNDIEKQNMLENENHNKFLIKLFSNFVTDENGVSIESFTPEDCNACSILKTIYHLIIDPYNMIFSCSVFCCPFSSPFFAKLYFFSL
jgi:hypothetical protein